MSAPAKPIFKAPESKPFKPAGDPPQLAVVPTSPPPTQWKPIDTAPQDADARFLVRATVLAKDGKTHVPVQGTETVVCYRASRKMVGRKWQAALTIVDDRLGTKLGFRPTEWSEIPTDA